EADDVGLRLAESLRSDLAGGEEHKHQGGDDPEDAVNYDGDDEDLGEASNTARPTRRSLRNGLVRHQPRLSSWMCLPFGDPFWVTVPSSNSRAGFFSGSSKNSSSVIVFCRIAIAPRVGRRWSFSIVVLAAYDGGDGPRAVFSHGGAPNRSR